MALMTTVGLQFIARNKAIVGMRSFSRSVDQVRHRLRGLMTAAFTVAGVGGFGYMIKQTMRYIDQVGKMADELQVSTRALSGWEHAAKISGTSLENLHKGLQIFVRRIGEARYGMGEGKRALEMLNLSAQQLVNIGMEEAFLKVADRISQTQQATERAAIAYNFFGRQGMQLLNMFIQGRSGIEALRLEAEKLGLTFSRFDALQVEAANDALTRMRGVFTGLFRQLAIQLAPYVETLATSFVDLATSGEGVGSNVVIAFEKMTLAANKFGSSVQLIGVRYEQFQAKAVESMAKVMDFYEKIDVLPQFKALEVLLKRDTGKGFGDWAKTLRQGTQAWKKELADIEQTFRDRESAIERYFNTVQKRAAGRRFDYLAGQADKWLGAMPSLAQTREMSSTFKAMMWKAEGWLGQMPTWRDPLVDIQNQRERAASGQFMLQEYRSTFGQIEDSMANSFENMLTRAESFEQAMVNIARSIGKAFLQLGTQIIARMAMYAALKPFSGGFARTLGMQGGGAEFMSAMFGHYGGVVGRTAFPTKRLPAAAFWDAPRLHDLASDERAFILKAGEQVLPAGVEPAMPTVIINNNTGTDMKLESEPYFDGHNWVVSIVSKDIDQGGPLFHKIRNLR